MLKTVIRVNILTHLKVNKVTLVFNVTFIKHLKEKKNKNNTVLKDLKRLM